MFCNNLSGKRIWKRTDTRLTDSLGYTPETNTALLFSRESESDSAGSDSLRPHGLYNPWDSPGQNTGVGSLSLLQGIVPIQGLNPGLPHCRRILYHLSHQGSPSESVYIYPLRLQPSSHPSIPPFYVITEGPWFLVALGFGFCPTRGSGVDGKQSQFWPPVKQLITLDL